MTKQRKTDCRKCADGPKCQFNQIFPVVSCVFFKPRPEVEKP